MDYPRDWLPAPTRRSGNPRARLQRTLAGEELLKALLLPGIEEQAEFGAAPEDVIGIACPFLVDQVFHFPCIEPRAQVFAQLAEIVRAVQQCPDAAAVGAGPTARR